MKGQASGAILGLSLTSENYEEAVAILKSRFGDPQIAIQTNMDVLLSLPNVESLWSHINLSHFEKITRGISFTTFETNASR